MERRSAASGANPPRPSSHNLNGQILGAKGIRTRTRLVEATERLLRDVPVRHLRVIDVAQTAGLSPATFYLYFDSVADVVLASVGDLAQSMPTILRLFDEEWTEADGFGRAHTLVQEHVRFWDRHRALLRVRNLAADEGDSRFQRVRQLSLQPLFTAFVTQVEIQKHAGRVDRDLPSAALANGLIATLDRMGAVMHLHRARKPESDLEFIRAAAHVVASALGCRRHARPPATSRPVSAFANGGSIDAANEADHACDAKGRTVGSKGAATRGKLIAVMAELLASTPLTALSVGHIARAASVSTGTFYLYFDSVTTALLIATQTFSQRASERLGALARVRIGQDIPTATRALVGEYLALWDDYRPVFRARNLAAEEGDARFGLLRDLAARPVLHEFIGLFEDCSLNWDAQASFDPYFAAATLMVMLEQSGQVIHPTGSADDDTLADKTAALTHIVLQALGLGDTP